jgi:purine-binding chemotaxis protein CheW
VENIIRSTYVVFALESRTCALPQRDVAEILPLARLWRPPGAPALIAGILNLAGEAVPVVSMRALFQLGDEPPGLYAHILLLSSTAQEARHAFLVDRAMDVVAVDEVQPVAESDSLNGCVIGELPLRDGGVAHLLATDRILMEKEKLRLGQLRQAAQARLAAWEDSAHG